MSTFNNDWDNLVADQFSQQYYLDLRQFLIHEYKTQTVYPSMDELYTAFKLTAYAATKVVIIGQDPYHGPNQAHGLAFSVQPQVKIPPSLLNIFKELQTDLGCAIPNNGYLISWAQQGVLLLNATLSVRANQPQSHRKRGWEVFTDHVIKLLNNSTQPLVFMLWGNNAKQKQALLTNQNHLVLTAAHPSPLSAYKGFFGCRHFSQANSFLSQQQRTPITWQIPNLD